MGHAINSDAETESSMNPSFLVFHAGDDKFSTPSDVLIDTSYSFFFFKSATFDSNSSPRPVTDVWVMLPQEGIAHQDRGGSKPKNFYLLCSNSPYFSNSAANCPPPDLVYETSYLSQIGGSNQINIQPNTKKCSANAPHRCPPRLLLQVKSIGIGAGCTSPRSPW